METQPWELRAGLFTYSQALNGNQHRFHDYRLPLEGWLLRGPDRIENGPVISLSRIRCRRTRIGVQQKLGDQSASGVSCRQRRDPTPRPPSAFDSISSHG